MIRLTHPSELSAYIGELSRELQRAAKYDEHFDFDDVLKRLASGEYQLWVTDFGFLVTAIKKIPRRTGNRFRILYTAGSILRASEALFSYVRQIIQVLEETALTGRYGAATCKKCKEIRFEGRKGWAKALPDYQTRQMSNGNYEYFRRL